MRISLALAFISPGAAGFARKACHRQDHPTSFVYASKWRGQKWAAKAGYRFADGYMCPSPVVRQDIIRWCGLEPSSTVVVPNPIPKFVGSLPAPPHRWLQDGEPPVFINTSNMTPWKRLDLLLEAFKSLRDDQDARLLIIGDGPERSHADQLIRRLQLNAAVETVGWVEDLADYAARAWAFVLASDEEGFAEVLTEAISVACPVVTTDAQGGGPRFVTDNGAYGLLVPTGDAASLSNAMAHLLQPDVRARYSELGRKRANGSRRSPAPPPCWTAVKRFGPAGSGRHDRSATGPAPQGGRCRAGEGSGTGGSAGPARAGAGTGSASPSGRPGA